MRKGNLLAILLFASSMAIISFGTLGLAMTLYAHNNNSAKSYANYQSYRAALEVSVYQYVADLCSVTVTRDLNSDWISVSDSAIYTQGIELIQETIGLSENPLTWKTTDIITAISATPISNAEIMASLLGYVSSVGTTEFNLSAVDYPSIDYTSLGESSSGDSFSQLALHPLEVNVHLRVKGEVLDDVLFIDNLYLTVTQEKFEGEGGNKVSNVTMRIEEGESGVKIYRQ